MIFRKVLVQSLDEAGANLNELQNFFSTSSILNKEKPSYHCKINVTMIKGLIEHLENVDRQTDTLTRQITALVTENNDKLEKIKKLQTQLFQASSQNLALLATTSNNFAGFLRLNVDYSELLLRFFVILRKGLLLVFKNCGQVSRRNERQYFVFSQMKDTEIHFTMFLH